LTACLPPRYAEYSKAVRPGCGRTEK